MDKINIPERMRLFQSRIKEFVQDEVDQLHHDTGLIVKNIDIPCEAIVVAIHGSRPDTIRVKVGRVNAQIDI